MFLKVQPFHVEIGIIKGGFDKSNPYINNQILMLIIKSAGLINQALQKINKIHI